MKQPILLFTFFALTMSLSAQMVFERSDYNIEIGENTFYLQATNAAQATLPSEGANQVWDYSNLSFDANNTISFLNIAQTSAEVPDANIIYDNSVLGGTPALAIEFDYTWYEQLDNNGHATIAREVNAEHVSLLSISGGAEDSLIYTNTLKIYEEPIYSVKFPLQYEDTWSSDVILESDFHLSVAAFGLSQVPGANPITSHTDVSVVGWGTLILPNSTGGAAHELEALVVKHEQTATSNWELGGQPAPDALLAAFGLTQGEVTTSFIYRFWVKGIPGAALIIRGDSEVTRVLMPMNLETFVSSTHDLVKPGVELKFLPNPIASGQSLSFTSELPIASGIVTFYDLQGRLIHRTTLDAAMQLPAVMSNSLYVYQVRDDEGILLGLGKLQVQ